MKQGKKSKKVKNLTETLLDYINVGQKKGKKKEVNWPTRKRSARVEN